MSKENGTSTGMLLEQDASKEFFKHVAGYFESLDEDVENIGLGSGPPIYFLLALSAVLVQNETDER